MRIFGTMLCFMAFLLPACDQPPAKTLFVLRQQTGVDFNNQIKDSREVNLFRYRNFYNGGGVAIGDLNNDGLPDLFFTGNSTGNRLYFNKGNFTFEDVSARAGITQEAYWNTGVSLVDINADGWLDIYVCNAGLQKFPLRQANALFINNKNGSFTDQAAAYGLDHRGYSTQASFFDYDLDGDLDCYLLDNSYISVNTLNYSNKRNLRAADWAVADELKGGGSFLLRNDNGRFTDVSAEAGIFGPLTSFGLGVTVGDVNGDMYPDIYISNDFFERDYLYINQKDGRFREELETRMQHISMSSMGSDLADMNNDGLPDLFVTDMLPDEDFRLKTTTAFENLDLFALREKQGFYRQYMQNTLQVNQPGGQFLETAYYSGVAASDWSWGGLLFDADNDGLNDIYVSNGIYRDLTNQDFIDFYAHQAIQRMALTVEKDREEEFIQKMPSVPLVNKCYQNKGQLSFADSGLAWGFDQPSFSNGAAYGDLDGDGDLDLVVNNINQQAFIYENRTRQLLSHHYLSLRLEGTGANTNAIGARVYVYQGNKRLLREHYTVRGFQSAMDFGILIGLGTGSADSLVVTWPDNRQTVLRNPALDQLHVLKQADAVSAVSGGNHSAATLLSPVPANFEKPAEDPFSDNNNERNIPFLLSRQGPASAWKDLNGDGREDLFIGGATGQPATIYLQQARGGFVKTKQPAFEKDAEYEDVAACLFDVDKDGDADLFVGAGGNHVGAGNEALFHRLYLNDGKGKFSRSTLPLPVNESNIAVVLPFDFDEDGDTDLFIGGRSFPWNYGLPPRSYLLENDGKGGFTDVTEALAPALLHPGLITAALLSDLNGDAVPDLVLTGEWMAPRIFTRTNGRFLELETDLAPYKGWWQTLAAADFNGDGRQDLVLGNIGENLSLRPTAAAPVKLWINDFDQNGAVDKVITRYINGKDMPVFLKRDLTEQLSSLKKQNLRHEAFAHRSIQELFDKATLAGASELEFNFGASVIAYNLGGGRFSIEKLPVPVQLSAVNAFLCTDLDGDGDIDLLAAGNRFDLLPQFGRLDASPGLLLLNDGSGKLATAPAQSSGFRVEGQVKRLGLIATPGGPQVLVIRNDAAPLVFAIHSTRPG